MRKLCVVTGTRAEYGLLRWIIDSIDRDPDLQLQLIVTGMHLSSEFGLTYKEIEADGYPIDDKIEILLSSDTPVGIAKSLALATIGFAEAFQRLQPDILVVLGDRFEILGASQAGMVARIPIAHLHGGEATHGLIDEPIRHSISKMAHFHFVATEEYRKRVIQLGENPETVFNVGAPGLENFLRLRMWTREELEQDLGIKFQKRVFLVTYHPVTLNERSSSIAMDELFEALQEFSETTIIFTKANADTDGRVINQLIEECIAEKKLDVHLFSSLGQVRFLSLLREANVVIGNSSSGIWEAPFAKTATVNLGDRQKGRARAPSIIDCEENREAIIQAVELGISPRFKENIQEAVTFYGAGNVSEVVVGILKEESLKEILMKEFYDLPVYKV